MHRIIITLWEKLNLSTNPAKRSTQLGTPELVFFSDRSDTPIPVPKVVKDLGFQTDNRFSPYAQCTNDANKARQLVAVIRCPFQGLSKTTRIPLHKALVHPHLAGSAETTCFGWFDSRIHGPIGFLIRT